MNSKTVNQMILHTLIGGVIGLLLLGCAKKTADLDAQRLGQNGQPVAGQPGGAGSELENPGPRTDLVRELAQRYAGLQRYADTATLRLTYHFDDGKQESSATTFTTRFSKPNQIHLDVASQDNRVVVVSDGDQITARILDGITKNFDDQLVVRDAPDMLSMADVYRVTELVDPIAPGEMISALVGAPTGLDMCPVGLVLGEGRLTEIANRTANAPSKDAAKDAANKPSSKPSTAAPSQSANHYLVQQQSLADLAATLCDVVEAREPEGTYRLWISTDTRQLRRIQFPSSTENLPSGLKRLDLVADFDDVRLDDASPFQVHDEGQQVSHFVMPPLPPSTKLLGQRVDGLSFIDTKGQATQVQNAADEITVLVWYHDHPSSRLVLEQLELLRRQADQRVHFQVIAVDADDAERQQSRLQRWNVHAERWTDTNAVGRDVLDVQEAPTTVVLGPNNILHYFEVGANPNVGTDVAVVLDRLLAKNNVAQETLDNIRAAKTAYKRQLTLAKSGAGFVEATEESIPAATQPNRLALKELWVNTEIADPGNMLLLPGKRKQMLVMEGWNQIAVLDIDGKLNQRVKLELPSDDGVTVLRAGKSSQDRALIAATTRGGRRAFVFDLGGKRLTQYPAIPSPRNAISDVTLADLDNDKHPELIVGWQGSLGVHGVSLGGKRLWTNRAVDDVFGLATVELGSSSGAKQWPLLVSGQSGSLFLIAEEGRTLRELNVGRFHQVGTWPGNARGFEALMSRDSFPTGKQRSVHCGFALSAGGNLVATGINSDWKPIWNYALPSGVYRHQTDMPQSITLKDIGPSWVFPGPDGSVHVVSVDGKFTDYFNTGKHIRGLGGFESRTRTMLVVATDKAVTAYEIGSRVRSTAKKD